jgi:hypothetical protein
MKGMFNHFRLDSQEEYGAWFKLAATCLFYALAGLIGDSLVPKVSATVLILALAFSKYVCASGNIAPKPVFSDIKAASTTPIERLICNSIGECRLPPELARNVTEYLGFQELGRSQCLCVNWYKLVGALESNWSALYLQRFGKAQHRKAIEFAGATKVRWMKHYKDAFLVQLFIEDNQNWCSKNMAKLCSLCRNDKYKELAQTLAPFPSTKWDRDSTRRFQPCHGTVYKSSGQWHINKTHNGYGDTLLITAVQQGHQRVCELLLQKGANVNHQNAFGNTSLHFAFEHNYTDLAMWLIQQGGDDTAVNIGDLSVYDGLADTTHLPM